MVCFSLCSEKQIIWIHRIEIAMVHNYSQQFHFCHNFENTKPSKCSSRLNFTKKKKIGEMWSYIGSIQLPRNNGSSIWQMGLLFAVSTSIYVSIFRWVHNQLFFDQISRSDLANFFAYIWNDFRPRSVMRIHKYNKATT